MGHKKKEKDNKIHILTIYIFLIIFTFIPESVLSKNSGFLLNKKRSYIKVKASVSSLYSFKAVLESFDTDIRYDEKSDIVHRAYLQFDFISLKTGIKKRDKKMLKWIEYDRFPKGSFIMVSDSKNEGERHLKGNLRIHGVVREVSIPYTLYKDGEELVVNGSYTFDYRIFSLKLIRFLFLKVKPELEISFHFEGELLQENQIPD